jgi:hypothetical protein
MHEIFASGPALHIRLKIRRNIDVQFLGHVSLHQTSDYGLHPDQ